MDAAPYFFLAAKDANVTKKYDTKPLRTKQVSSLQLRGVILPVYSKIPGSVSKIRFCKWFLVFCVDFRGEQGI